MGRLWNAIGKMRFTDRFIFKGLPPLKMVAHPYATILSVLSGQQLSMPVPTMFLMTMAVLARVAVAVMTPFVPVAGLRVIVMLVMMMFMRIGIQQDQSRQPIQWPQVTVAAMGPNRLRDRHTGCQHKRTGKQHLRFHVQASSSFAAY
jgi:hypothetical protein